MSGSYFSNNRAGGSGGAIAIDSDEINNILVSNTTFTYNTASSGGGGAIYSGDSVRYDSLLASLSLLNNTFSNNTSAYCGVLNVDKPYHNNAKIVGNTFTYNRAVGQVAGTIEEVLSVLEMPLSQFWKTNLATMWQQEMLECYW